MATTSSGSSTNASLSNSPSQRSSAASSASSSSPAIAGEVLKGSSLDRAIPEHSQLSVVDDPFAEFLRSNWRTFVIILVAAGALFYGSSIYRSTQATARQSSGDSFIGLQKTFAELQELGSEIPAGSNDKAELEKLEGERAELAKRFDSQLKSLSFAKVPYPELAEFYGKLHAVTIAENSGVRTEIITQARFKLEQERTVERLTSELLFLAAARNEVGPNLAAARTALEMLADNGLYASGAAAKTLVKLANDSDSIARAKVTVENLVARQPELAADLAAE
jgi:hypothetical protein